jgi:hypothetical protein
LLTFWFFSVSLSRNKAPQIRYNPEEGPFERNSVAEIR